MKSDGREVLQGPGIYLKAPQKMLTRFQWASCLLNHCRYLCSRQSPTTKPQWDGVPFALLLTTVTFLQHCLAVLFKANIFEYEPTSLALFIIFVIIIFIYPLEIQCLNCSANCSREQGKSWKPSSFIKTLKSQYCVLTSP